MPSFLKFLIVGTIGFIINTTGLVVGVRFGLKPSIAGPAGAELAIISNFILNNFFTFSDRSLSITAVPAKFIQFNVLSFGSVIIQFLFLKTGEAIFGMKRFKEPVFKNFSIFPKLANKFSLYLVFYCSGVGVGLIVNYFIYSQIIWK